MTEARVLRRLARGGGQVDRHQLGVTFARHATAADLDRLAASLAGEGLIDVEWVETVRKCRGGFLARHRRALYRLTEEGREAVRMAELERLRKTPMSPRPAQPEPDNRTRAEKILDALRAAGGSSQRNNLRLAIHAAIPTAEFDRIIAELVARGQIVAELQLSTWRSPRGVDIPYRVMVYTLSKGRPRREPRPVEVPKVRGGRVPGPPITLAEAEARIIAALREADGESGRTDLREGMKPKLPFELFNDAIASLDAEGLITIARVTIEGRTSSGNRSLRQFARYSLAPAGKKTGQGKAD